MQTLLELFDEQEKKFSGLGVRGLHKLKYIYDSSIDIDSDSFQDVEMHTYDKMRFELRVIFKMIESLEPKDMRIMIDDTYKKIKKLEFNPTISGPNISFRDKLRRDFSIWYKPVFYVPIANSAKEIMLDFAILRGVNLSMYFIDPELKRELYQYEFLSDVLLKDISIKMLNKLKQIYLGIICKQHFTPADITKIKTACYFLKPIRLLLVSENYVPDLVKMALPINTHVLENVDFSDRKITDVAKKLF